MDKELAGKLCRYGQSLWLDYISRSLIKSGELKRLIGLGIKGLTSNPTIFENAVSEGPDYDSDIQKLSAAGKSTFEIYDDITVRDIQDAADLFRPVYEESARLDGYVSLEVNPELASDTEETIKEARRLHKKVTRPNVMFKVPSTKEGFPAVEELLACGINVNVTLIFSLGQYVNTVRAYMKGIKRLMGGNGDAGRVRSVASVFVSRVDTVCDKMLDEKISKESNASRKTKIAALKGKAAQANSSFIYAKYQELFGSEEFKELQNKGANIQRVLWGSTSTKNPDYSDIKYVAELIGRGTVNTLPGPTFDAFLDHGSLKEALPGDMEELARIITALQQEGIDIKRVCEDLLKKGVEAFQKSFISLLGSIESKIAQLCKT